MIKIQDSNFGDSYSFHELIVSTFQTSIDGIGMYSFASSAGVNLLFNDTGVLGFLSNYEYYLLVGTDSITNEKSIESLEKLTGSLSGLKVKAYLNDQSNLFHPKFSLFQSEDNNGTLLIGSNNLTTGGLRKNIEALGSIKLSEEEFIRNKAYLDSWLEHSNSKILDITDPKILDRVKLNNITSFKKAKVKKNTLAEIDSREQIQNNAIIHDIIDGWTFNSDSLVLFAEIPKSGDRWKQANFNKSTFQDFFGATPGNNIQRILLRSINLEGQLANIEVRPSVSVVSQNYRFELDAASGLDYPSNGKAPVGVFIKLTVRMFIYKLFMPNSAMYEEILEWMQSNWTGRNDRKIRIVKPYQIVQNLLETTGFTQYLHENES